MKHGTFEYFQYDQMKICFRCNQMDFIYWIEMETNKRFQRSVSFIMSDKEHARKKANDCKLNWNSEKEKGKKVKGKMSKRIEMNFVWDKSAAQVI